MAYEFVLPDLGEGLTEAEVVSWLVDVGDTVAVDQSVVEVESAKSVVSLPCPFGGVVAELHASIGDSLESGDRLITIGQAGADTGSTAASDVEASPAGPSPAADSPESVPGTALRSDDEGSGAVLVGYGTRPSTHRASRPTGRFKGGASRNASPAPAAGNPPVGPHGSENALDETRNSPVVSPLVRRLAADHGFNARHLQGSGPGDVVMRADVDRHISRLAERHVDPAATEIPASASAAGSSAAGSTAASSTDGDTRIPLTGLRKTVAEKMTQSRREIPEATIWMDVDATELLAAKDRLQLTTGERFGVVALIARFVVAGLAKYPILNSSFDSSRNEIVRHDRIDLGLAAQTPRGLMVPVVHGADGETLRGLRDRIGQIVDATSEGKFAPEVLSGSTFTLNNYGPLGTDGSTPIINYPEAAMLGVGRIIDRPWVVEGELAVRKVVLLSLVFDHRVCDGADPSGFLTYVAKCIEDPMSFLADV